MVPSLAYRFALEPMLKYAMLPRVPVIRYVRSPRMFADR
jgi:hypothetical protein